jgi:hypothetical protein
MRRTRFLPGAPPAEFAPIGYPEAPGRGRHHGNGSRSCRRNRAHGWEAGACWNLTRSRVETLLAEMALGEKVGQLTLVSSGLAVTGPGRPVDYLDAIRAGRVGTRAERCGPERTREVAACGTTCPAGRSYPRARRRSTDATAATGGAGRERG